MESTLKWNVVDVLPFSSNFTTTDLVDGPLIVDSTKMSATSSYSGKGPSNGLLNNNGYWKANTNNANQYLQITLDSAMYLSGIASKGCHSSCPRDGSPQYVKAYKLDIDDGSGTFVSYKVNVGSIMVQV